MKTIKYKTKHPFYNVLGETIDRRDAAAIKNLLNANRHLSIDVFNAYKLLYRVYQSFGFDRERQAWIIQFLKSFLDGGIDVNSHDKEGITALHIAIKYRMTKVIDYLISRGANLQVIDKFGNSMLHFYILTEFEKLTTPRVMVVHNRERLEKESSNFIEWMIEKGLDVDCKNKNEDTAIHLAAEHALLHVLPILLDYTKNVTIVNNRKLTAFQIFTRSFKGSWVGDNLSFRVEAGKPIYNENSEYVCEIYVKFWRKGVLFDVIDDTGSTPLHYMLKQAQRGGASSILVKIVRKELINFKNNITACDELGNTILHVITAAPKVFWSAMLWSKNHSYESACVDIVQYLISQGADIYQENKNGLSPLFYVVVGCKLDFLKIFNENGADFQSRYKDGKNLLHCLVESACKNSLNRSGNEYETFLKIIDFLLDKGLDINEKDIDGKTLLHDVVECKWNDLIGVLVKKGAQVDIADKDGFLPLHKAILLGEYHCSIFTELLIYGANINDNTNMLKGRYYKYKFVLNHAIKLKLANMYIDEKLMGSLKDSQDSVKIQKKCLFLTRNYQEIDDRPIPENCLAEIEVLKDYKIIPSTSIYDLFQMSGNSVCNFINNDKLKELINSPELKTQFPMYHVLISSIYYRAITRRKILDLAEHAWYELTGVLLPDVCVHQILSYLSNANLRVMIDEVLKSSSDLPETDESKVDNAEGADNNLLE